ncbi:hypothetical protein Tco_0159112, partial [Tanacetum coccineum]
IGPCGFIKEEMARDLALASASALYSSDSRVRACSFFDCISGYVYFTLIIDSGCSRHMTGNKCYLTEYEDYDGGFVSFGDGNGCLSGKD